MMNYIWVSIVILAIVLGGINGKIENVTKSAIDAATGAVTIAIGLIGIMALWLGIMKIAEDSGLMTLVAKAITPILKKLFPDVPAGHPAMASMTMNIAGQHARPWQRCHGTRVKSYGGSGNAEQASGNSDECHVHIPDHQYRRAPAGSFHGYRRLGFCRFERSDGDHRDHDCSHFYGTDRWDRCGETIGKAAGFFR